LDDVSECSAWGRLPATTTPTCSKCSALVLNTLSQGAASTPTLNETIIEQAIKKVNEQCGPSFASYNANPVSSAALGAMVGWGALILALSIGIGQSWMS
jgi:hypothetical protein